jgi:hypothetical protein
MSDPAVIDPEKPAPHPEEPFTPDEIQQFDDDDVFAGRAICKMLSTLFVYTLVAMSFVSYWTWINEAGKDNGKPAAAGKQH